MHPYLKERLRDLKRHGWCKLEAELFLDESIVHGPVLDEFNEALRAHFNGQPFLVQENDDGDWVVRAPENRLELAQAIGEAVGEDIDVQAFGGDGQMINRSNLQ